jgi:hypothetical protein
VCSDSPMRRLPMRSRLPMRRLRRGHYRLRRLCGLHLQLQLLHIVGILRVGLLELDNIPIALTQRA